MLARLHVHLPALLSDLEDAAEDDVADFANIPRAQRPHRDQLVHALDHAGDRRDERAVGALQRAVAAEAAGLGRDGLAGGDERQL